jgi:glycosyltransferase involved in cell wall biosynthesis
MSYADEILTEKQRRVLILNNYPMDRVLLEVAIGETPNHVLFGVEQLESEGIQPIYLPYPSVGAWAKLQNLLRMLHLPLELGDLQQQVLAIKLAREVDLIYAPCGSQTHLLQYLRAFGFFNLPIVTLLHHPFPKGKLDIFRNWQRNLFFTGADRLLTLSKVLAAELLAQGIPACKVCPLTWGVDLSFYGAWRPPGGNGVVATGRTGRDFKTFAVAAKLSGIPATVIGLEGHLNDAVFHTSPNVRIIEARNEQPAPGEDRGWIKYPALCNHMRDHSAIAIPLFAQRNLAGLTGLMDALGLGRAVIMTRNSHIDLDIEAEGIGFWVEPGDVDGWAHHLRWIHQHPDEVQAMGFRARALAERGYCSNVFSKQIAAMLHQLIPSGERI